MSPSPESAAQTVGSLRSPQALASDSAPYSPLGCGLRLFGAGAALSIAGSVAASLLGFDQAPPLLPTLLGGLWLGARLGARSGALQSVRWRARAVAWELGIELGVGALLLAGLAAANATHLERVLELLRSPLALFEMAAAVPLSYAALQLGEWLGVPPAADGAVARRA